MTNTKIGFKHQFCKFYTKKGLNKRIKDYIKVNKYTDEEIESINIL